MEERSPKNAVLQTVKTVLIVLAVFAAAILYIFISSAVQGKNYKGKTSDMYGRDSLEYVGEPEMKVYVWQKNEKSPDDYPDHTVKYGVNSVGAVFGIRALVRQFKKLKANCESRLFIYYYFLIACILIMAVSRRQDRP